MVIISKYFELKDLDINNFETKTEFVSEWVSIYYDIDPEEIIDYTYSKVIQLFNDIKIDIKSTAVDNVLIEGQYFYKLPFNKITLGEWIDLDYYIKNNMILETIIVLYRIKKHNGRFLDDDFEEYGYFIEKRKQYFNNLNIEDVLSVRNEFIKWKEIMIKSYSGLFITQDSDDDDYTGLTQQEIREIQEAIEQDKKSQQFIWERIVMELVNNDLSKFNDVLKLPVIQVFNILSMIKVKK